MFKNKSWIVGVALVALIASPALATSSEEARRMAEEYQKKMMAGGQPMPEAIKLEEKDVTRFIEALGQFKKLGLDAKLQEDDPGMAEALAANAKAQAILSANGFTPEHFQRVVHSISYAIAKIKTEGQEPELAAAMKKQQEALKKMESSMTPEQIAMLKAHSAVAQQHLTRFQEQDPENVRLVKKYLTQLEEGLEMEK